MLEKWKRKWAQKYIDESEQRIKKEVDIRVAKVLSQMDIIDVLLKDFHGVFSNEFARPEEKLDGQSHLQMLMWAYQQNNDICFKYLYEWVVDSTGNEMVKRAPTEKEYSIYGRAQISTMILWKREVGRLAGLYEEWLEKNKAPEFDPSQGVD